MNEQDYKEILELFYELKKVAEISGEEVFLYEMENQIKHLLRNSK